MLMRAEGIAKSFGPKVVLKDVMLQVDQGERIGLVGINGAGKTTLIKILMGVMRSDVGEILLRVKNIGYLPQLPPIEPGATIASTMRTPDPAEATLLQRATELEHAMDDPEGQLQADDMGRLSSEYAAIQERLAELSRRSGEHRVLEAMSKVGLEPTKLNSKVSELSGGERTKVFLARVLMSMQEADLLFLDEPTSHLDIGTVEWLEGQLKRSGSAMVIISHDRYFLDSVATRILELEDGLVNSYSGNYSDFIEKKRVEVERQIIAKEKDRTERARQAKIAEEMHRRAWFSSTHKVRLKMLERMGEEVKGPIEQKQINLKIEAHGKHGREFVSAKSLSISRGGREIITDTDLQLEAGDKLGVIGPNGSGKTTLLLALLAQIECNGELWVAPGADIGYFAQGHDGLDPEKNAEAHLTGIFGQGQHRQSRDLLAQFLICGKDADRPVSTLSGGERARVALAMLIAERKNLLLLDEPTNYLDIPSRHAVEAALSDYAGSLIVVTHDRYFLDAICNKVGVLENGRLEVYNCTYSRLREMRQRRQGAKMIENEYVVVKKFKEWSSGRLYTPGETILMQAQDFELFRWALETGKLKRSRDV